MRWSTIKPLFIVAASLVFAATQAQAASVADFYKGKTFTILVGFSAGGGFDLYARVIAAHLGRHIPGNPTVIVQNMPGAGSYKAASYLFNAARKDGSVMGSFLPSIPLDVLLRGDKKIQPAKFNWIGRITEHVTFAVVWHNSPAKSVAEAKQREITIAATSLTNISATVAYALNSLVGTKFKVVKGYRGSSNMAHAMESGETNGAGGASWELINYRKPHWLSQKKIRFLWVILPKRFEKTPDVPSFVEFAKDNVSREVLQLLAGSAEAGRSYAAPPGVPAERVAALRTAFLAMTKDSAFLAMAKKRKLRINPGPGDEVQRIVARLSSVPAAVIERTRQAIKPR